MSENKFIKRLKGEQTAKSVLEIKNESAKTSFANMPQGTSNAINVYSDHRGNATAVLEGTDIWKLNNSQFVAVPNALGDGRDFTSTYTVFGSSLWVNATYTFDLPKIFTGATQWTLKLCGHSLLSSLSNTIGFSLIIKFGNAVTITKSFSVSESAFEFCKEFIVDFSESEQAAIKVVNGDTMTVQLLCADATASATIYNGMTTLTALQRRVDGDAVASDLHTFEDLEVEIAEIQDDIADINGKIIVRSATIPTAGADLAGKAYQYAGTTNGVYTHNYIYECQEIETNSYGWVRADVQPDRIAQIQALQADVSDIEALIPAQATPQNQLGDKAFINSSIATNTANFIGTFNSVAELEAYTGTVTNNDYAFVIGTDSAGNTTYNRYKYNANTQQWTYEYTLNNSSFTADQWTAINSGVTASDVSKARSAVQPSDLGNGTITITQGGTTKGSFTTNQDDNTTIDIDAGGGAGHNVGDIFLTMRNDNELNGAVECDGATYNTTDFTGAQSIGQLLADGKVPYVSMATYATEISTKGWCDKFGWDGTGNVQFKVPTLNAYIWQKLQAIIKGSVGSESSGGGGKYFVLNSATFTQFTNPGGGGYNVNVANNQTITGASADATNIVSQQRCMVQLATSASDEALETCTGVLADVAALKYDYVVDFQAPTAANNYTWYRKYKSGWVEQGGIKEAGITTINFPVAMANTDYWYIAKGNYNNSQGSYSSSHDCVLTRNTTNMVLSTGGLSVCWEIKGMAAS